MKKPNIYWGTSDNNEVLTAKSPKEAAIEAIERLDKDEISQNPSITVFEYKRMSIDKESFAQRIRSNIEEHFDEEYGDPEDSTDAPNEVVIAIDKLVDTIEREMQVYWMNQTGFTISKTISEWESEK